MNASPSTCAGRCGCQPCACPSAATTPLATANRPGLSGLRYRVGTHGAFMAAMQARLGNVTVAVEQTTSAGVQSTVYHPLQGLTTRELNDPAMALLDGWASLGDVLTFYQERIANEGYLRTAQERRSVLEMARLVGYELKPGVAASVFLAFTVDDKQTEPALIPLGTRAQSLPGPGETAQVFETSEDFSARAEWNNLRPRSEAAQDIQLANVLLLSEVVVEGTSTQLKTGDNILLTFEQIAAATQMGELAGSKKTVAALRMISKVVADADKKRSQLQLQPLPSLLQAISIALHTLVQAAARVTILDTDTQTRRDNNLAIIRAANRVWQQALLAQLAPLQQVAALARQRVMTAIALPVGGSGPGFEGNSLMSNLLGAYIYDVNAVDPVVKTALETFEATAVAAVRAEDRDDNSPERTYLSEFVQSLLKPLQPQVANSQQLARSLDKSFRTGADNHPQLLLNLAPGLRDHFYTAWENANLGQTSPPLTAVYALRATLTLFGANVAKRATFAVVNAAGQPGDATLLPQNNWQDWTLDSSEANQLAFLESVNAAILPESLVIIDNGGTGSSGQRQLMQIQQVETVNRTAYGLSAKCSKLSFATDWWNTTGASMDTLRKTLFLAQSDELTLAKALIDTPVFGQTIDLDGLYKELQSGRFIILTGERADIKDVSGIEVSELLMIESIVHNDQPKVPGDSLYSTLHLATRTAYRYRRDTIQIAANVVRATHGETRSETLGSGDGSSALQCFTLKQAPLTFVSANNPQGVQSTLAVTVDNITWHETDSLNQSGPHARQFVSQIDDDDQTRICFGNGVNGARLPTGVENIKAVYRQGIGKSGNARAGQISQLLTRPLGVREVLNPLRASGGADRETRDQARKNVPLAVMALDRLVALADYASFARTFGGIGKAEVARISDGRRELIHLTVAGAEDAPLDPASDLMQNLKQALLRYGDPDLPLVLQARELTILILAANIKIDPDYQWEVVEQAARQSLLDAFSFERRELGQSALLCEVIAALQNVPGVVYVDVDSFGGVPEKIISSDFNGNPTRDLPTLDELATIIADIQNPPDGDDGDDDDDDGNFSGVFNGNGDDAADSSGFDSTSSKPPPRPAGRVIAGTASGAHGTTIPAQLLLFVASLPDTLILNQIK